MPLLLTLLALFAGPAAAQTVHAPALGRSVLPGFGVLNAAPSGILAAPAARPTLAPAPVLSLPILPAAASPAVAAQPAPAVRAVLESVSVPLAKAAGAPAAQAPVLSNLFEGRRASVPDAVVAGESFARPAALAPARNAAVSAEDPAPPAPRPVWKTAGLYALRTAGFLGALAGGFRV
ncbi:hypothetical protein EPO15_17615, partial [bacterium]